MNNRIVFENENGGVSVIIPSPDCNLTIEQIAKKDVPIGAKYAFINVSEIPSDRTYRDAWQFDFTGALIND